MTVMPSSPGRRALVWAALAFLWSVGVWVAALVAPVYGSQTLVQENGRGVVLTIAAPSMVTAVAWLALWYRCHRGGRVSTVVAWACVWVLGAFCVVGILTVGLFVAPAEVLLMRAVALAVYGSPQAGSTA